MSPLFIISKFFSAMRRIYRKIRSNTYKIYTRTVYKNVKWGSKVQCASCSYVFVYGNSMLSVGNGSALSPYSRIYVSNGSVFLGDGVFIGIGSIIVAREYIEIGKNTQIAEYVTIRDQDHIFGREVTDISSSGFRSSPIRIGENVWIGAKATILKGVTIGDNSVVGANSVISKDIPANVVAAGNPASVIKEF